VGCIVSIGKHEKPNRGETDIWLTPLDIISPLGDFDLDPCGEAFHKTANTIYTERGLSKESKKASSTTIPRFR
jgi:hypothetical protein